MALGLLVSGLCQAALDELVEPVEQALADGELLSAVIAVHSHDGAEIWSGGHVTNDRNEKPDRDTAYQIGSITKPFTHLLLAEMVARGEVRFDTTIADILGDEVEFENEQVAATTLVELATHAAGFPRLPTHLGAARNDDPYAEFDRDRMADALATLRAGQPLTDRYAYSNLGSGLLGYLLGRIDGGGYAAALRERVIEPLGLTATGVEPSGEAADAYAGGQVVSPWTFDTLAGAGALWSTADDLLKAGEAMLGQRDWPLSQDAALHREIVLPHADRFALTRVWHVVDSEAGPVYWHNGGTAGHRSFFGFRPATGEALVLLFSGGIDPTAPALAWFGHRPGRIAGTADPTIFGRYELAPGIDLAVFEQDGLPMTQLTGQSPMRLYPAGEDWYALHGADASLRFARENGRVTAVELVQNGVVQRAERSASSTAAPIRAEAELPSEALSAYTGRYRLGPGLEFTIRRSADGLEAQLTGQPFLPIYPRGDDVFFYKVVDAALHFERRKDGSVDALVLHQGGIEQRASRIE